MSLWNSPGDTISCDAHARRYYAAGGHYLWITAHGIGPAADSLVAELHTLADIGFTERSFDVEKIEDDLRKVRQLDFGSESYSRLLARLEYRLTRAYLRYATGERFGYCNPRYALNRLRTNPADSLSKNPRFLCFFDMEIERPGDEFYALARRMVRPDSLRIFLGQCHPRSPLFLQLRAQLPKCRSRVQRDLVLCNMERARWREKSPADSTKKRLVVNLAAQMLYAYCPDSTMEMRVCCGSLAHHSPLLSSWVSYMEVNPVWNIPYSIISREVARHAGDEDYFQRNNYTIYNKESGEEADPAEITAGQLRSGAWRIVQSRGEGNSLGRYIFRFPNDFSVYLHDTSNAEAFQRTDRAISHGCIRVQRPRDLALFLLDNPTGRKLELLDDMEKTRYLNIDPKVHVLLAYYTLYPDSSGTMRQWPDGYGYDQAILRHLKPFCR